VNDSASFSSMIWLHVIAAIPPTLAGIAALITALKTKQKTNAIHVLVNGERVRLLEELAHARAALAKRTE
jgi:hypothetical protein